MLSTCSPCLSKYSRRLSNCSWSFTYNLMLVRACAAAWCSLLWALPALHKLAGSSDKCCNTCSRRLSGSCSSDCEGLKARQHKRQRQNQQVVQRNSTPVYRALLHQDQHSANHLDSNITSRFHTNTVLASLTWLSRNMGRAGLGCAGTTSRAGLERVTFQCCFRRNSPAWAF